MEGKSAVDPSQAALQIAAQAKIVAITSLVGREIRVFVRPASLPAREDVSEAAPGPSGAEESDDFYEFTLDDYARIRQAKKAEEQLKTKKTRDEDASARQSRITKAVVRVQFPDGWVVESSFLPSDPVSEVRKVVEAVLEPPAAPFYLYTTPPKQPIRDEDQSLYAAGLAPGALIYYAQERIGGCNPESKDQGESKFLRSSVIDLKDLHLMHPPTPPREPEPEVKQEEVVALPTTKAQICGKAKMASALNQFWFGIFEYA